MNISSIDNKNAEVANGKMSKNAVTLFDVNGPHLDIEGYATIEGINTSSEHRIRKTLLFVQNVNLKEIREKYYEYEDISDEEIMADYSIECVLENRLLSDIVDDDSFAEEELNSLAGYVGSVNLGSINHNKPLWAGTFDVYIKLEQLSDDNDNVKYEKILPISNLTGLMKRDIITSKVEYFSKSRVLKYNLIVSFDDYSKTLQIKNALLQSYNPKDMPDYEEAKENRYIAAIKRRFFKLCYILFCILPINKKKIVFASDSRSELNGNLYFVYEELHKRDIDLKIKFIFNERIDNKKSFFDLFGMAFQFATSNIILLDDFYPMIYPLRIRKNADLVQVWHAAGAFKTFGFSRVGRPGGPSLRSRNHKNYTKAVVSSEGIRENYAEGFGITEDKVYATGTPRADIFFDDEYKTYVRDTLYQKYPHLKNKKIILFAPTFRGNGQASAYYPFENLDFQKLYEAFHEEYVFLFKIHPFVKNKLDIPYQYGDFFFDFSDYREINDLLLITDILITDYSSVCFEFALLNKPMLFFAFDVEKYIEERDFYYNYFDFIPGPLIRDTDEMITTIKEEKFQMEKIEPFVGYFFDDTLGQASKNVVDEVIIPSLENDDKGEEEEKAKLPIPKSRIELFERTIDDD